MGAFLDYHNKRNRTSNTVIAPTNSNNTSSFLAYHKKREEERKKQEALRKAQEEAKRQQEGQKREEEQNKQEVLPKANEENSNKYTIEANNKKIEDLQKQLQSAGNNVNKVRELGTQIKNLKDENDRLQNPEKYQTDVSRTFENLGLGLKKGLMNFSESGVSAINRTDSDRDKMMDIMTSNANKIREEKGFEPLPTAEESRKIILGDSYNKDLFGRDKEEQQKKWEEKKNNIDTKIASNIENTDSVVGKKLAEIAPSIGNQLPGYVLPEGAGLVYFTGSAKGAYMEDAKAREMSEEEANTYSGIMAIVEGLTEQIGAGLTKNIGKNVIKGSSKEALKYFGLDVAENFIEEAVMEPISETTATLTGGSETANWDNMGKRMLNSGIDGALSSIIMAGTSAGIGKAVNVTTKLNNNQQVSSQEIVDAVNETIKSDKVNQEELKTIIKENTSEIINRELQNNEVNIEDVARIDGVEGQYAKVDIENNQETLYNNNESEADINGQQQTIKSNDQRGTTGLFTQHEGRTADERGYQIINEEQITRTKQEEIEYIKKPENQITNLSNNQAKIKEAFETKGAKVVFYSLDSNKGGYYDNGTLYINENKANDVQQLDEAMHEYAHYLIRDNTEFNSKISSIAEEIVRNEEYGNSEAIRNYIMDRDENISIEDVDKIYQTVVEEILADYAIDVKKDIDFSINNQYGIDINTLNKYKKILKDYLPDIELENSNESSFSMPKNNLQNKKIAPPPVQQNTQQTENKKVIAPLPKNYSRVNEQSKIKGNDKTAEILGQLSTDKMTLKENKDFLIQKLVNKGHYIDQLAKITKNKELTYKYDRMLGASSEGQYEVGVAQTDNKGNKIGKSINDIWKPAEDSKTVAEFSDYLLHKHNIDRMKQGKPVFGEAITAETSKQMVENYEKLYPEFKEWSKDIYNFNKNQLRNTTEAGLTSEELETLLDDMYSSYVTISRDKTNNSIDKKSKVVAPNRTIKKAVGGNSNIQPLKDAMAKQAIAVKQAIRRNDLGLELMNTLKTAENVETYDINNLLSQDKSGSYLLVFDKGQAKKLKITQGIYESLKPSQKYKFENTMPLKAVQKASSIQRSLLTVDNPIFMITNFFKDFQDGMFNSKYTSKFMKNYGRALVEIKNNGKYYNEYMANGGNSNTYFDYEKGVKKDTKVSKFIDKIRAGNEVIEMAPRLSEYISTREAGGSVNEALYNAAEITTNFKRGGEVAKVINRNGANFLNASIQGLSKQIRNISGQNGLKGYVNLLSKATLLSVAPAILNHLLLGDDEEYQDLPDYVKDTYYLFKIGDNKFLRIPKGRVLSIFGSAARRTLEYAEGNEEAFKGFGDTVLNQMAPNNPLSDNIFAPIVQSSKNETWYGGDLVPTRLQDELPENQYDESTDSFSKWLGKLTGISPMKINYVIDQYSGGLGDILLPMMTPQAENNVLTDKFTIDSVLKNKNVSKFYETLEKQTQISNSPEATDEDMLKTKYLNGVQSSVSDLYKEKREIQLSDLNNKEKKEEVKEIQEKINEILEEGLRKYDKGKVYSNYATIGNEQYYKATNLKSGTKEWKKLSEEEVEKNKNISLKTYADYKEKVAKETISQRKLGTIKEEGSLKSKDKIQILLNSNYSSKEKTAIYENYILSSTNTTYPLLKKSGIDIDEYMKYLQQDFKSDKKDNGTTSGKTVAGSAKRKTYEYVNSMNISYEQKLLLLGTQYKLNNEERTKLYNYVKTLDYSQEEMQKVFEKLQGFTVYKDGRVTW